MNEAVQALRAAADALEQKNARIADLEAALEPFAASAETHFDYEGSKWKDYETHWSGNAHLSVGDLRRARAALAPDKA